jgi:hypothetical protein
MEGSDIHVMLTKTITKKAQKTNHFERFHTTPWPRESRLGRIALGFSKKLGHHIGAIKRFIDVTTY